MLEGATMGVDDDDADDETEKVTDVARLLLVERKFPLLLPLPELLLLPLLLPLPELLLLLLPLPLPELLLPLLLLPFGSKGKTAAATP